MLVSHLRETVSAKFSDLVFDEEKHLYYVDGVNYPSVSSKVSAHANKFEAEKILPHSAAKASRQEFREVTVHELRHRWQTTNKLACDLGHETHTFMENYTGFQTPTTPQQLAGTKFFKDMSEEYEVVFREIRMYSRKYKYAGTDDLLLIHRNTGRIITADYKTNGDLFKNYKGQTLHPPFEFLLDNPYNKYQMQLSYYQIMLEEAGLSVDDRLLVYLRADGEYRIFHLDDYTNDLKQLMTP